MRPLQIDINRLLELRPAGDFIIEVVGESHYQDRIDRVIGRAPEGELVRPAWLYREPANQADPNATVVVVDGWQVGYLSREDAVAYQPVFRSLESWGRIGACSARLGWSTNWEGRRICGVRLDLATPSTSVPVNWADTSIPHVHLPDARRYQVRDEADYSQKLGELLARAFIPGEAVCIASIAFDPDQSDDALLSVEGQPIGHLSKQTAKKLKPLLDRLSSFGVTGYCPVVIKGNSLSCEAVAHLSSPEDLSEEFLQSIANAAR